MWSMSWLVLSPGCGRIPAAITVAPSGIHPVGDRSTSYIRRHECWMFPRMIEFRILGVLKSSTADIPRAGRATPPRRARTVAHRLRSSRQRRAARRRSVERSSTPDRPKDPAEVRVATAQGAARRRAARERGGYVLDVDPEWIDLRRFERLVADGRFTQALGLWRGELLADFPDADFATLERSRVDELRLHAIESHIVEQLAAGDRVGIGDLAELVEEYPLRERLTSSLMLALYRAGRQVEALRAFDQHRRRLAERSASSRPTASRNCTGQSSDMTPRSSPGSWRAATCRSVDIVHRPLRRFRCDRPNDHRQPAGHLHRTRRGRQDPSVHRGWFPPRPPIPRWRLAGRPRRRRPPWRSRRNRGDDTQHRYTARRRHTDRDHHPSPTVKPSSLSSTIANTSSIRATMVSTILTSCQNVHIVATSRCPLGVDSEFVRPVHPLAHADAAQLFVDHARLTAAQPSDDAAARSVGVLTRCR